MSLEQAIVAHLSQSPDVCTLIGKRVYPVRLKQGSELPALVYQIVSEVGTQASGGPADLQRTRVQFTAIAPRYELLRPIIDTVVDHFAGFVGQMGGPGGALVQAVIVEDLPATDDYDDELEAHLRTRDVVIWWVRSPAVT